MFSPAVIAPLAIIGLLLVFNIPYDTYLQGTGILNEMLGVVTVAFAVPLYRNRAILAANSRVIVYSLALGSLISVVAGSLTTFCLGMGAEAIRSVIPRSITTPIAMNLSRSIDGIPTLTAVFVMLTSYCGVMLGPVVAKRFAIKHPLAIGMMYGMGAHALGTLKAFEQGELAGSCSSLSVILGALITVGWAFAFTPLIVELLL